MAGLKCSSNAEKTWIYGIVSTMDPAISQSVIRGTKKEIKAFIFSQLAHAQQTDKDFLIKGVNKESDIKEVMKMLTGKAEFKDYAVVATATECPYDIPNAVPVADVLGMES